MRKVLHVGPCNTPGGMATVMHTLAQHPPDGWKADLLASHAPGNVWTKWRAYRRAKAELKRRCASPDERPDVVHVHAASDWSLRRKLRLLRAVRRFEVPAVLHHHSGRLAAWMGPADGKRAEQHRSSVAELGLHQAVLSEEWKRLLAPVLGPVEAVVNPVGPKYAPGEHARDTNHVLVLGRDDPVKGHGFAEEVVARLVEQRPDVRLSMTGRERSSLPFVQPLGWVSEEKKLELLQTATVLLLPSSVEGQPLVVLEALACGLPVIAPQRLHSLPEGTVRAGPSVEDWVQAVEGVMDGSFQTQVNLDNHRVAAVAQRWGALYASWLKD
ncbi:MAG: glycosyltransferase family 4 protein [Poseidonia sp.]